MLGNIVQASQQAKGMWAVQFLWGRGAKSEIKSVHFNMSTANSAAKQCWDEFMYVDRKMVSCDKPGEPYDSWACIEAGAASLTLRASEIRVSELSIRMLKAFLKEQKETTTGTRLELEQRLQQLVDNNEHFVMVEQDDEDSIMFQSTSDEEDEPVEHGDKQMFVSSSDEEDECASSARTTPDCFCRGHDKVWAKQGLE